MYLCVKYILIKLDHMPEYDQASQKQMLDISVAYL